MALSAKTIANALIANVSARGHGSLFQIVIFRFILYDHVSFWHFLNANFQLLLKKIRNIRYRISTEKEIRSRMI